MTELMRPALYGAFHRIEPVCRAGRRRSHYEIVGPVLRKQRRRSGAIGLLPTLARATSSPSATPARTGR
jgi:hypothetical protein